MSKNPIEEMLMPCPLDICDGSGVLDEDTGAPGAHDRFCPHSKPDPDYDADNTF